MKKNSKIFMALMVVMVTVMSTFILVGCTGIGKTVATELTGAETEAFAFAVNKGNTTMVEALNEFVLLDSTVEAFNTSVAFHDNKSDVSILYPDLSQYKDNGAIIMLTEATFAPYEYLNNTLEGSVGGVAGVDVDLMILFAASQEKTLTVKNIGFDSIILELKNDKVGNMIGAAGMSVTADRQLVLDFSKPYTESIQYIISAEENSYATLADLKGLIVGVQEGTTGKITMDKAIAEGGALYGAGVTVKAYKSTIDAYMDLENGRLGAIMLDEKPAKNLVAKNN